MTLFSCLHYVKNLLIYLKYVNRSVALLRIVAGKYRGIVLNTFELDNVRPTPDKVREAVFSKIQFHIAGSSWLDLFGGTGAVGLEAYSRGAESVVVCDDNADSIKLIEKNYAKCKMSPTLIRSNYIKALNLLSTNGKKFDFVYLDPPFASNYGVKAIKMIARLNLLSKDGVIIYEHSLDTDTSECNEVLDNFDNKKYGTIVVSYFRSKDV